MDKTPISLALLNELMIALNHMPNQASGGVRWRTTYQLAAELSRALKEARHERDA